MSWSGHSLKKCSINCYPNSFCPKGPTGPTGATGASGVNGTNGATGASGVSGAAGASGASGDAGNNISDVIQFNSTPGPFLDLSSPRAQLVGPVAQISNMSDISEGDFLTGDDDWFTPVNPTLDMLIYINLSIQVQYSSPPLINETFAPLTVRIYGVHVTPDLENSVPIGNLAMSASNTISGIVRISRAAPLQVEVVAPALFSSGAPINNFGSVSIQFMQYIVTP